MVKANRRNLRPRPLDHGDPRTPMAWQSRNLNYHQNRGFDYQSYHQRLGKKLATHNTAEEIETVLNQEFQQRPIQQARPTSPSTDSDSSSSTAEPDRDSQLKYDSNCAGHNVPPDLIAGSQPRLGTLRSMQSTLSTWDGEPCPIHSGPSSAHVPTLRAFAHSPPPCVLYSTRTCPILPPPMLLPPMLRPRPLVLPADNPAPPTPLPVRDPRSPSVASAKNFIRSSSSRCCRGNILLLWVIMIIIFIGVLLGVITRLVVA